MERSRSKKTQYILVNTKPGVLLITPYAMAKMSTDLHFSSKNYSPGKRFPLVNYFLYCASIELALKATILSVNYTKPQLHILQKDVSHDLIKLVKEFKGEVKIDLLEDDEVQVLAQVNKFYKDKGLEYFTDVVKMEALTAYKNFPDIKNIEKISNKLNKYLGKEKYFINATTPEQLAKNT
jgi:hypothetical protein